jgi:hypothetical protein
VIWSLVLLACIIRVVGTIRTTLEKHRDFKERSHKKKHTLGEYYKNFALRVLAFDLVILSPIVLIFAALKISGKIMGTDADVTIISVLGMIAFQYGNAALANEEFKAITHFVHKEERKRLIRLRFVLNIISLVSYLLGATVPTLAALFLDKTLGPIANYEYVCIIIRNVFMACFSAFALWSNSVVNAKFEEMIKAIIDPRSVEALEHMKEANKDLIRLYLVISLVYVLFTIPPLWAFQTYCYGALVFFALFRSPAKAFKSMKTFTAGKTGTGTNEDPEAKAGTSNNATVSPGGAQNDSMALAPGSPTEGSHSG